jgi:hypothetical protein
MPCLLLVVGLAFPRLILALLFLFTDYLIRPFQHSVIIELLGFLFLPLTTLIYAVIINSGPRPEGLYLVALVICVLADLGFMGGGFRSRRRN